MPYSKETRMFDSACNSTAIKTVRKRTHAQLYARKLAYKTRCAPASHAA
jgi:hypothetical protein